MGMLDVEESLDRVAKSWSMWWYNHFSRKDDYIILKAFEFRVQGSRWRRPKRTRKKQVEDETRKNGLVKENTCEQNGEAWLSQWPYEIRLTSLMGKKTDQNWIDNDNPTKQLKLGRLFPASNFRKNMKIKKNFKLDLGNFFPLEQL